MIEQEDNVIVLSFAEARKPAFKEVKKDGFVHYGEDNLYPNYLLSLFNGSPKHGAITRNKAKYVAGNGFNDAPFVTKFSANVLLRKAAIDCEVFDGAYLEIVWTQHGHKIASIAHVDYLKIRTNKDNTQFWYKDDWENRKEEAQVIPAFNPATGEKKQILYIKGYRPGLKAYALPGYITELNWIESDIEVGRHTLGNAKTGFTPSKMITLPNGEPSADQKKRVTQRIERAWSGSDGKKFIIQFVKNADQKALIEDLGTSDLSKEDFTAVNTLIENNIFAGHEVTTPALFGVAQPGKLGSTQELRDGYEIFNNVYANDRRVWLEISFNMLSAHAGYTDKLTIQPVNPLGITISDAMIDKYAPKSWVLEKLNIDPEKYPDSQVQTTGGAGAENMGADVNGILTNLTPVQERQLRRLLRQHQKGVLTDAQASLLLKRGFNLADDEIAILLGLDDPMAVEMAAQEALTIFAEYGEARDNFSILKSKQRYSEDQLFGLFAEVSQAESNVLDLISKDKRITPEVIADTLEIPVKRVRQIITAAERSGLINSTQVTEGTGGLKTTIVERKLTAPLAEIVEKIKPTTREYLIRYSYEWLPEIPADERNTPEHPSRDFCKELMRLDRFYSRADIEQMSAQLGYSVFDRRGGWWNNNGENKKHCRHMWQSNIVIRK
jgi:hypothetical protein